MQESREQSPEPLGDTENLILLTSCLGRSLPNNRTACNGMEMNQQLSVPISQVPNRSLALPSKASSSLSTIPGTNFLPRERRG